MLDALPAAPDDKPDDSYADNSINIPVPGGLSLVVSVGLVCLTVFLIFVGMGKVDVALVRSQIGS